MERSWRPGQSFEMARLQAENDLISELEEKLNDSDGAVEPGTENASDSLVGIEGETVIHILSDELGQNKPA